MKPTAAPQEAWSRRGFWALIATQFQGAFNDNLYRWIITFYLLVKLGEENKESIVALGAILFAIPYIVFPGIAGALSDRFSKRKIAIATKTWEVGVMTLGLVAFTLDIEPFIWAMLFMMNMQSTFFSPAKYGILPEMLPESRLSWGNGILNMASFVAIVSGTACAGLLFELELAVESMSGILIALSALGLTSSFFITKTEAADPARSIPINPWSGLGRPIKTFLTDRILFLMLCACSFFWFAGALIQQNVPIHGKYILELDEFAVSWMVAFVGIGIGTGSFAAGYFSRGKIELGLVPAGMFGLIAMTLLLAIPGIGFPVVLVSLLLCGFAAGFYVVPVYAMIQYRSPKDLKGGMIAALNVVDCVGIFVAGALFMVGGKISVLNSHHFYLLTAGLTLAVAIGLCSAYPTFLLRLACWKLTNSIYRLRIHGAKNIPDEGGAILVANTASCVDALVITAATDRTVRFIMGKELFDAPGFRWAGKVVTLPVPGGNGDASVDDHLAAAAKAVEEGKLVCIFRDGQPTASGAILPFNETLDGIRKHVDAPVVPVYVDPLYGRIYRSTEKGPAWRWPTQIPYPIAIGFGAPLDSNSLPSAIHAAIQATSVDLYAKRLWPEPLLHRAFIRRARRMPFHTAVADMRTPKLSYIKTLAGSIILGRKLRQLLDDQPHVGVLLPPTVGGSLTNVALQTMGRIPINLNYTIAEETMAAAAEHAGVTQVITAKAFLEKLPLKVPGQAIYLEDVMASVTTTDRIIGLLMAVAAPKRVIEHVLGSPPNRSEQDTATIIFSSGSEGVPKGAIITNYNLMCNIESVVRLFPHEKGAGMAGILPFFHCFGFMATLWLPLVTDLGGGFHPSPLEARPIGKLIRKHQHYFFVSTSTFLQNFIRRCAPEDFASLGIILCGAEKLVPRVRDAFIAKFGVEPLEGYGVTECSPAVSVNTPEIKVPGLYVKGNKRGTIGRPMPGVAVRVVDPDTGEPLGTDESGLLLVKGGMVMQGYLDMPERTQKVLKDGWYTTGDIAAIDEDGYITITDRLSRFSKIGGEMVPHVKVEEALQELAGKTERVLAIASAPDTAKGERLIVLHTLEEDELDTLISQIDESSLPNLWRPRANAFYRIDEIPILGTGKMDIKSVKRMALELDVGE